jgi:hypothetical protein
MPFPRLPLLLIALALQVVPSSALAQRLKPGNWTGTVTPPGEAAVNTTFDVRLNGDTVSITLKSEFGEFPLTEIKVEPDRLLFTFSPGTTVRCTLMLREDASYSGDCLDSDGGVGVISMSPPGDSSTPLPGGTSART